MSTNDVPGSNTVNRDVLAMGCWAEHSDPKDPSLIFVEAVESGRVIYSMFDLTPIKPLEFRDSMMEDAFKKAFSWKSGDAVGVNGKEKWIWHDKTSFPWDKVIKNGITDGARLPSADATMSAAERVANSLKIKGVEISRDIGHRTDQTRKRVGGLMDKIKNAVNELRK